MEKIKDTKNPGGSADLGAAFLNHLYQIPGGEKIKLCIQCGTCSGSCPTSAYMDYTPREIIASLRAGLLERVIHSNTVWLCSSCYYCTTRCPSGIKFTDIMYELKRLGIKHNLLPPRVAAPVIAKGFIKIVNAFGRLNEGLLIALAVLTTNPLKIFRLAPLGLKLFLKGRLRVFPERIKGAAELKKMEKWLAREERA